ncbi:MAG: enoyl-CoA hydratase/isomerase family protein [Bryobacteraceae bacterium]
MQTRLDGRVFRITLDRPERRNALNEDLCLRLVAAFREAEQDERTGAILLDASGPMFCAGMDLDESLAADAVAKTSIHEELFTVGARCSIPIVAAARGGAIAGGVGLVAQAHVVICDTGATFGLPEVRIGMWPFVIWTSLVRALGERRALALSLTGDRFSAAEAKEYGLVHHVVDAGDVAGEAESAARAIAETSPSAVRRGMQLARQSRELDMNATVSLAAALRSEQLKSAEYRDKVESIRAKRKR